MCSLLTLLVLTPNNELQKTKEGQGMGETVRAVWERGGVNTTYYYHTTATRNAEKYEYNSEH